MHTQRLRRLSLALAVTFVASTSYGQEAIEEILIVGIRDNRTSEGATGLALDIKSTPQSISLITREMMDSFGASDINSALDMATGVQVERWETNRTNYLSRGFEIKNTQIDGVGLPNNWGLVTGAIDAFGYEKSKSPEVPTVCLPVWVMPPAPSTMSASGRPTTSKASSVRRWVHTIGIGWRGITRRR